MTYVTKDSGERAQFESGMVRDSERGKPRFDLLLPLGVPYEEQMLTRDAMLMARGAEKYDARNWEKARGQAELDRYHSSALRHLMQWIAGETDEDHAAGVRFNIMAGEYVKRFIRQEQFAEQIGEAVRDASGLRDILLPEVVIDHEGEQGVRTRMTLSDADDLCPDCRQWPDHALQCPQWTT